MILWLSYCTFQVQDMVFAKVRHGTYDCGWYLGLDPFPWTYSRVETVDRMTDTPWIQATVCNNRGPLRSGCMQYRGLQAVNGPWMSQRINSHLGTYYLRISKDNLR
jgi:hypothetical protein